MQQIPAKTAPPFMAIITITKKAALNELLSLLMCPREDLASARRPRTVGLRPACGAKPTSCRFALPGGRAAPAVQVHARALKKQL